MFLGMHPIHTLMDVHHDGSTNSYIWNNFFGHAESIGKTAMISMHLHLAPQHLVVVTIANTTLFRLSNTNKDISVSHANIKSKKQLKLAANSK